MERRQLLKIGLKTGALLSIATIGKAANQCGHTPAQTEGPFYPIKPQAETDWDLLNVSGLNQKAQGDEIIVVGQVRDQQCLPVAGALVEIWQACASGRYNHPNDPNPAPLDPNFQYWGRSITDENGFYFFRTLIPGSYPATEDWIRPPHIHYKVHKRGYSELTTQLYFANQQFNATDKILQRLSREDQDKVVCPILNRPIEIPGEGVKPSSVVQFDLEIEKL